MVLGIDLLKKQFEVEKSALHNNAYYIPITFDAVYLSKDTAYVDKATCMIAYAKFENHSEYIDSSIISVAEIDSFNINNKNKKIDTTINHNFYFIEKNDLKKQIGTTEIFSFAKPLLTKNKNWLLISFSNYNKSSSKGFVYIFKRNNKKWDYYKGGITNISCG